MAQKVGVLQTYWTLVLASSDAALAALDIYFGNMNVAPLPGITGNSTVYNFNGLEFVVGGDGTNYLTGDMACAWIAPGVSLLDGTGHIPLATRRAFIDANGNPVYLGTTGQIPTGTSPAVFLSATQGNAASFSTNLGTGGAFTVNGDPLTLAAANP